MATTQNTPDVFDQLAVPSQQAKPQNTPDPAVTSPPQGQGDVFDQLSSNNESPSTSSSAQSVTPPVTPQQPSITATPEPTTVSGKVERWARNLSEDLKYGTDLTGIGTVLKKMGAHGVYSGNPAAVGDFMASLPLGLSQVLTGMAETAQPGKRVQGAKDTASGALQASTFPSAFVAPEGAELAGQGVDATASAAVKAANAVSNTVRGVTDVKNIQPALQQGIRNTLAAVAKDVGVDAPTSASIRDVAAELSNSIRAKSSALYSQLDAATGGVRFQRFSDSLSNIERGLRDALGVDPEKYDTLLERKAEVEQAQQAALDQARAKGVDPSLIDKANATWKQQAALSDLSTSLRQSVSGLRPEIAEGANGTKVTPETVNPKTLFSRINRLYDKGRLADAIGQENAQALLQHVDSAYLTAQKITNRNKFIGNAAKTLGLGGLGYEATKFAHDLFGNSQ